MSLNIATILREAASDEPDKSCLVLGPVRVSSREVDTESARVDRAVHQPLELSRIVQDREDFLHPAEGEHGQDDERGERVQGVLEAVALLPAFDSTVVVVIDAAFHGNDARWINHSCDPNCEADVEDGRIFITSLRDIPAGAELTYDYRVASPRPHGKASAFAPLRRHPRARTPGRRWPRTEMAVA